MSVFHMHCPNFAHDLNVWHLEKQKQNSKNPSSQTRRTHQEPESAHAVSTVGEGSEGYEGLYKVSPGEVM